MAKKKIYISFDFANDRVLKNELVAASQADDANFKIANWSMKPADLNSKTLKEMKFHISKCDAMVIIVGENTETSEGVKHELDLAKALNKPIIPLLAHPQNTPPQGVGEAHDWSPETLSDLLSK